MAEQAAVGFGGLLRQLRARAKLTQEELAEAASLSPRSVSDLEHLRRDNIMITTNTVAVAAKYRRTQARTGAMARTGSRYAVQA